MSATRFPLVVVLVVVTLFLLPPIAMTRPAASATPVSFPLGPTGRPAAVASPSRAPAQTTWFSPPNQRIGTALSKVGWPSPHASGAVGDLNPVVARVESQIASHQLAASDVFLPAADRGVPTRFSTTLTPTYPSNPAPMGIADLGLGSTGPYEYETSSFEGSLNLSSFSAYSPGYAVLLGKNPNATAFQLNTVTVNTSYPGAQNGSFWIQNVVEFNGTSLQFINNIWNFSRPGAGLEPGTLLRYNGTLVSGELYYRTGPTFSVSYPFTVHLYNNVTTEGGHPGVYFNYTLSNHTGTVSGSYDYVTFNGTIVPSAPPRFEVSGLGYTPMGYLFYDAELTLGGDGGGSNAVLSDLNATTSLARWNTGTSSYESVPSAYDYGEDTGETSVGVASTYSGTTESLVQGPSFLYGLWNTSATAFGPTAAPGTVNLTLRGLPSDAFAFVANFTTFGNSSGPTWSYSPAEGDGVVTAELPPVASSAPYEVGVWADGYTNQTVSCYSSATCSIPFSLTANTSAFDAPVYLASDAQANSFASLGLSGVTASPASHALWINRTEAAPVPSFLRLNDFGFPTFLLFAAANLTVNVSLDDFSQNPTTFNYSRYGAVYFEPDLTQAYDFTSGTGLFSITNTSLGSPFGPLPMSAEGTEAATFWGTTGMRASLDSSFQGSTGVDVLYSKDATVSDLTAGTYGTAFAALHSTSVTIRNVSAVSPPAFFAIASLAIVLENDSGVVANGIFATGGSAWVEGLGNDGVDLENLTAVSPSGFYLGELTVGQGLTIDHVSATNLSSFFGILLGNYSNVRVQDASFVGHPFPSFGLIASSVNNLTVSHLRSSNEVVGLEGVAVSNFSADDVTTTNQSVGILSADVQNVSVSNVRASSGSVGAIVEGFIPIVHESPPARIWNVTASNDSGGVGVALLTNAEVWNVNSTSTTQGAAYISGGPLRGFPDTPFAAIQTSNVSLWNISSVNAAFGLSANASTNLSIRDLTAWDSGVGVDLNRTNLSELSRTFVDESRVGALLDNTTNISLTASTIEDSASWGVSLVGGSNFSASANNFVANHGASTDHTFDAANVQANVSGSVRVSFTEGGIGNYWSDWSGSGDYPIGPGVQDSAPYLAFLTNWLEFNETGLPAGLAWGFTLDTIPYGTSAALVYIPSWSLPNASLGFTVDPPTGWAPTPPSGIVPYTGANQTVTISFGKIAYRVSFVETGLPTGRSWSVTFNGSLGSSSNTTISFVTFDGSYSYVVSPQPNYTASPSGGNVIVFGSNVAVNISFAGIPVRYGVTFTESGLPGGTPWWVQLGTTNTTTSNTSLTFHELNGTYGYTIGATGYLAQPSLGTLVVNGHAVGKAVVFSSAAPVSYAVTFSESGLPNGINWTVTFGGSTERALTPSPVVFSSTNGTTAYSIHGVAGYASSPASGNVTVDGAPQSVQVVFSVHPATYAVTFTESGLPTGTNWSVTMGGTTASSTGSSLGFLETNGTYSFSLGTVNGYVANRTQGSVDLAGGAVLVSISFSPAPSGPTAFLSLSTTAWLVIGVAVVAVVIAVSWLLVRRSRSSSRTGSTEFTPQASEVDESDPSTTPPPGPPS
jgi:hypothetical protein